MGLPIWEPGVKLGHRVRVVFCYVYFLLFLQYKKSVDMFNDNHWFLLNDSASEKMTRNRLGVVYSTLGASINKKLGTYRYSSLALSSSERWRFVCP